jgi:hypothetical protein
MECESKSNPPTKKKKKEEQRKKTIAFYFRALCWLVCDANIGFESAKDQKINDIFT